MKKEIKDILPSIGDAEMFSESKKGSASLQIKELQRAIDEKYEGKIKTNVFFEVVNKNKFRCNLELQFDHFKNDWWFHFVSFEKKLDEDFPIELFAFPEIKSFGIANNKEDFDNILVNIIKNKKTEYLILNNI